MNTPVEVDILNEICYMLIKLLYNVCVLIKKLFHHTILLSLDGQSVREIWTLFRLCHRVLRVLVMCIPRRSCHFFT